MRAPTAIVPALARSAGWFWIPYVLACSDGASATAADAGTSAGDASAEESPEADACEHGVEGPFVDVVASADAASAPEANTPHTAQRVALVAGESSYLTLTISEAGEYALGLGADLPATLEDGSGQPVAFEATEAVAACDAIAVLHRVDLGIGTYRLTLGPSDATEVLLVAVHAGDHDHPE